MRQLCIEVLDKQHFCLNALALGGHRGANFF